jgi:predicted secreted protein
MSWVLFTALFFVTWWLALFVVLPFGVRTQDEDHDVTLGTVSSAPRGPHMLRAFIRATIVTMVVMGILYGLTTGLGLSFDDIMRIMPDFTPDASH